MKNKLFKTILFSLLCAMLISLGNNVKAAQVNRVENVKVSLNGNKATISWDKFAGAESNGEKVNFDGYAIIPHIDGKLFWNYYIDGKDATSHNPIELEDGKKYVFEVGIFYYMDTERTHRCVLANYTSQETEPIIYIKTTTPKVESYNDYAKISWKKLNGVEEYQLYRATSENGQYTKIKTLTGDKSSYKDKNIKKYTEYYYKIKVCKKIDGQKYYSQYSKAVKKTALQKAKLKKIKYSNKKITISWNKIKNVKGYEIYRAVGPTGKFKKIATVSAKKTSYTDKKIKNGYGYYYKIRAYRKNSKYGGYSNKKHYATGDRIQQMNKMKLLDDFPEFKKLDEKEYKNYQKMINKVTNSKMTTYEKAKAIYKYIVTHLSHNASNCVGYTGLLSYSYRMIGLDAYWVNGGTKTTKGDWTMHKWVVVFINDTPYTFDASLERHNYDRNNKKMSYRYFFKTVKETKGTYSASGRSDLIVENVHKLVPTSIIDNK